MEARIARLESDVSHLRADVGEIKIDMRALRDKIDALRDKIDSVESLVHAKFDDLKAEMASAKIWALLLYIALAATNAGALAGGMGWI